jgi:hypothetical protein
MTTTGQPCATSVAEHQIEALNLALGLAAQPVADALTVRR